MKLSLDYQQASNARVLPGVITEAVDGVANTASVSIDGGIVAGVPIHYLCNHNLTTHADRVFRENDVVLVLYTGAGATPSSDNMTILGLRDEVRRCLEQSGIVAGLLRADGSSGGLSVGNWLFSGSIAMQQAVEAGSNWWSDGTQVISWAITQPSRYSIGSNTGGTSIFKDGVVFATAPASIAGAALQGTTLVMVDFYGHVWKKPVGAGWTRIYYRESYAPQPKQAVNFSADGTRAVSVVDYTLTGGNQCILIEYVVEGDSVDLTWENQLHTANPNFNKPIAADFKGNELVIAGIYYEYTAITDDSPGGSEIIYDQDGEVVVNNTYSSIQTQRRSLQLRTGAITHNLMYEVSTVTSSGGSYIINGSEPIEYSNTTEGRVLESYGGQIIGMDLRLDLVAVYMQSFSAITTNNDTNTRTITLPPLSLEVGEWVTTYGSSSSRSFSRWKELLHPGDNLVLSASDPVNCVLQTQYGPSGSVLAFGYPIPPEEGYDISWWTEGHAIWTTSNPSTTGWCIGSSNYNALGWLSHDFKAASRNSDVMTSLRLKYNEAYMGYTGGDVAALTGFVGPLYAGSLKVV